MKQQPLTYTLFNQLILLCFWLSWLSPTFADDVNLDQIISLENASWEIFTNRSSIQALTFSTDGKTLWVGTKGGLEQRHTETGELMRVFTTMDGLPDNNILALLADSSEGLWVGTERGGLAHYQANGQWTVFNKDNSDLPDNEVTALLADGSGGLWVGTDGGLAHYQADGQWTVFNQANSDLPDNSVYALLADGNGGLWVGTDGGLAHYQADGQWTVFNQGNSDLPTKFINALLADGSGGLWVGTLDGGLAHYQVDGQWTVFNKDNSDLPDNNVSALLADGSGGLWVGTDGESLAHYQASEQWTVFNEDNSDLPDNFVRALSFGGSRGLWVGTGRGLAQVNGQWTVFNEDNSDLPNNYVNVLLVNSSENLWMGTGRGLAHYQVNGQWTVFNEYNSDLPHNTPLALLADGSGGLWVGTIGGLAHYQVNGQWTVFNQANSDLQDNTVYALLADGSGGLWVGTSRGLAHYQANGRWTVFYKANSPLPSKFVSALSADGSGGLWVGTYDGLAHYRADGQWTVFNEANSGLPDNGVNALLTDGSGGLWVGTRGGGLAHYQADGQWTVFNKDNSDLPDNTVSALSADGSGGLWVGTLNGGLAHLTFSQKTSLIQTIEDEANRQELLTGERAAILIHPRGQGSGYNQEVSIQFMATHAYRTLNQRGYDHDEIYFLSHKPDLDINGDGIPDRNVVDGPVNYSDLAAGASARDLKRADVEQAFAWAKQQGTLTQPLLVVFVDHALTGQLRLDPFNEVLTAADFNQLFTDYQQTTANSVVVILEACHTGSLIAELSAPNRLIITSTATNQAYYDNLGQYSFSKFYFDNLRRGENYYQAFQMVKDKIANYGHPFAQQIPQLEDDGDGTASTSNDGRWAKQYCLNGCFVALAGEITLEADPLPTTVTPDQAVELSVRAGITEGRITRVWALVMTPEIAQQRNDQGFALLSTPVIDLKPSPTDQTRWQGQFSEFHYQGDYVITYMAKDNEGFITSTAPITVTLPDGPKPQPRLVANKSTYHNGDKLEVTLPALPAEQNQHAAITLPDGTLFLLTEKNLPIPFDGSNLLPWTGNDMAIELPIDPGLPRGEYTLYLLRVPVEIEQPLTQPEQWILGVSTFSVK